MNKKCLLFIICLFVLFPICVKSDYAVLNSYTIKDMTIKIDKLHWDVFTRENLSDSEKELKRTGIEYEKMKEYMESYNIYLEAMKYDTDVILTQILEDNYNKYMELSVVIQEMPSEEKMNNLHEYDDATLLSGIGERIKKEFNDASIDVYSVNGYKFIHVKYYQQDFSNYNERYFTIINGHAYTMVFLKQSEFTTEDENSIKEMVDSIKFDVDNNSSFWSRAGEKFLTGALTAALLGGLSFLFNKNKKVKK